MAEDCGLFARQHQHLRPFQGIGVIFDAALGEAHRHENGDVLVLGWESQGEFVEQLVGVRWTVVVGVFLVFLEWGLVGIGREVSVVVVPELFEEIGGLESFLAEAFESFGFGVFSDLQILEVLQDVGLFGREGQGYPIHLFKFYAFLTISPILIKDIRGSTLNCVRRLAGITSLRPRSSWLSRQYPRSALSFRLYHFLHYHFIIMGGEQATIVQERLHPPEYLSARITQNLAEGRLDLSHKSNIWQLCRHLRENYANWEIAELKLEHNMIAGQVVEELTKINFEKAAKPLRVLALGHNDIICDNLKYFRGAYFNSLLMLYLDHNQIGTDGCFYLSKTSLQRLQTLDLSGNLINEKGAGHLANCNLPKLLNLNLCNNQISYSGLLEFTRAHWPSLAFLQLKSNAFEPTKDMEALEFRTEVKMFRLELQ